MLDKPAAYIAIGDSMSIDLYPVLDASERSGKTTDGLGAASLLYRNNDDFWPEFAGQDLATKFDALAFCNLTADGATTFDFLDPAYLDIVKEFKDRPSIITVTLGGNDILRLIHLEDAQLGSAFENLTARYDSVIDAISNLMPRGICILTTVYDPSDGTGVLDGLPNFAGKLLWLKKFNDFIRSIADRHAALFADVHAHFLGHGLSQLPEASWYWNPSPIEPGSRGASEIRRLWFQSLAAEDLFGTHSI